MRSAAVNNVCTTPRTPSMNDVRDIGSGKPQRGWSQARTWAKFRRTLRDASSEPGCSRDQEQPCPDDDGSDGSRDALTGRCETFDGDGCRDDSHRAEVHDPDDQKDRDQTDAALAAVEAEAQTV